MCLPKGRSIALVTSQELDQTVAEEAGLLLCDEMSAAGHAFKAHVVGIVAKAQGHPKSQRIVRAIERAARSVNA